MGVDEEKSISPIDKEQEVTTNESRNYLAPEKLEDRDISGNTSITGTAIDEIDQEKQDAETTTPEAPPRDIDGWRWIVVVLAILSSTFLFALDNTIVADIQYVKHLPFSPCLE